MENKKRRLWKHILVRGILSAMLLSGCGRESVPQKEAPMDKETESAMMKKSNKTMESNSESLPSKKVMKQVISEWKEMYDSFYDFQDCSAVLSERTENDGTVDEVFMVDITYMFGQPDSDEPEHFIADMKASYPADNPEEITLWMDNSGGAMTDLTLFKECGPS
ncbi:MAG: hypothetical protein K2J67_03080 [Lachnospiraceae bacterium]|nr:hypothetical protein [Lachnospiraceae bacterium]